MEIASNMNSDVIQTYTGKLGLFKSNLNLNLHWSVGFVRFDAAISHVFFTQLQYENLNTVGQNASRP